MAFPPLTLAGDVREHPGMLTLPDTELAHATRRYIESIEAPFLVNHSIRSYLFGRAIGEQRGVRPGEDYDDELLFAGCALHDIGLTDAGNGDQRFEVDGADLAKEFLLAAGVSEERAEIVWDAVALHTSLGIANRKRPEIALAQAGIGTDVLGRSADLLPPGLADEVHEAYPRQRLGHALADAIVAQARDKPGKAAPHTFPGELVRQRAPDVHVPDWNELVAACVWRD